MARPGGLRWAIAAVTGLLLVAGATAPAAAQRSIHFDAFDATVEIGNDGGIEVRELIRVTFEGQWNGIFRRIPIRYETPQGFGYKLFLDVESVTDDAGQDLEHWLSNEAGHRVIKIRVPGALDATRTVAIRYSVSNALRFFEEHDEFYWNVTGDEWEGGIRSASARIVLPEGASGLRTNAWTGVFGSTNQNASIEALDSEVYVETTGSLAYREGLTVAIAWNPGVVERPGLFDKAFQLLRSNVVFAFPLGFAWIFFSMWRRKGRDPKVGTITTQYEPPEDLRPAELGTLIDGTPHMRDITATLIDLAVRGYFRMEEVEREGLFKFGDKVRFVQLKDEPTWSELQVHEREVMEGLFSGRNEVDTDDLKNEFYTHLPGIKNGIWARLLSKGYYAERPDKTAGKYIGLAILATIATGVLSTFIAARLFLPGASVVVAVLSTAALTLPFAALMPARTPGGVRTLEKVLGFEEFLTRADADRLRRMNTKPETFEAFLPYAMALGVEGRWAKAFEGIFTEPPDWYRTSRAGPFRPTLWMSDLSGMTTQASRAMTSAPRQTSSGSSGFSGGGGGGFSGGGFGGGGGGGW